MKTNVKTSTRVRAGSAAALIALALVACGGGGGGDPAAAPPPAAGAPDAPPAAPPAGPPASPPAGAGLIDEAAVRACPSATSLIQSTEWSSCLAGRSIAGTEVFTGTPCELRVGQDGAFDYLRNGAVFLSLPPRPQWTGVSGLYQNTVRDTLGPRLLLASLDPSFPVVAGQPYMNSVDLTFVAGAGQDESVEIEYFDALRTRITLVCRVNVL